MYMLVTEVKISEVSLYSSMGLFLFSLVSSNSSYSDLMPQFLRAVRALCNLYPIFKRALQRGEIVGSDSVPRSVPASPATTDSVDPFQSGPNVRRARSFGSLIDSNSRHHRSQTATNPVRLTRRGHGSSGLAHRRTHSQTLSPSERNHDGENSFVSSSSCKNDSMSADVMLEEPFQKLEVVWVSLESWFDLILAEVEKTAGLPGSEVAGKALLMRRMQSVDGNNATSEAPSQAVDSVPEGLVSNGTAREGVMEFQEQDVVPFEKAQRKRHRGGLTLSMPQSNLLAAAIVKSTPVERRVAYLRFVHTSI